MLRHRLRCGSSVFSKLSYVQVRNGYIVLLPEIPKDTAETNPLLRLGSPPEFRTITPENCFNGIGKLVIQYDTGLSQIEENFRDSDRKRDFQSVVEPLERLLAPLDHAWSTVKALFVLRRDEKMSRVYETLHPHVQKARAQRFQSLPLYHALKELNADQSRLDDVQRRVVRKYLLEARLNGLDLTGYDLEHLHNALKAIATEKNKFTIKLREATSRFKHVITDYGMVRDFPEPLLRRMAVDEVQPTRGPWTVTLQPRVFEAFVERCSDRDLRWNVWQAYHSRASSVSDNTLNNSIHIEELRFQRQEQAKLLGYSSYAEMSMETKMAGSIENVRAMIASLQVRSKPKMEKDLEELQAFASGRGFDGTLEIWDVPYWRRKHRQSLYRLDEEEIRCYFPLPRVLNGLFALCQKLFGVTIEDATRKIEPWDDGVAFYEMFDESDSHVGSFYLDPYFRMDKLPTLAMLESGINRCDAAGVKPVAFLFFGFQPPMHGSPSLLSFSNLVSLFEKFGKTLQHVLTRVPYSEVAGLTNVEWDAVDVCAHFLALWLDDVPTLQSLGGHHRTGQLLSVDVCENIVRARRHFAAYDLTRELYLGALDLALYTKKDFWLDVQRRLWSEYMPFPLQKNDAHTCSFSKIFVEEYQAAYYSSMWAQMMAADLFSAFREIGSDNEEEVEREGRRFRDVFLSMGGGCHPSELFRRFRGRDPSPDALVNLNNVRD